jgi:phosphatidylethanolamine-binding protein (PEBP) family uncharacterized protein
MNFALTSSVLSAGAPKSLPARYTCDGADVSPPFEWTGVPAGTKELALFIANSAPGGNANDWAVMGLKPTLRSLAAGKLTAGAIVGRNSQGKVGYSICPGKGTTTQFGVVLYALTKRIAVKPGFNGHTLLNKFSADAPAALIVMTYTRH